MRPPGPLGSHCDPSYEEAITKQVGNTTAFDLTLNGDDEWSVTLTAQVKEGYYRMSLTDGTATNADGTEITSAKQAIPSS